MGMERDVAGGLEESVGKSTEAAGDWKTTSVNFRKAENGGVIASCSKERENPGKDTDYNSRYKSQDYAFGNVEEAAQFLLTELSGASSSTANSVQATAGYPR